MPSNSRFALQCWLLFIVCFSALSPLRLTAQPYSQFTNGAVTDHPAWRDTTGNLINAHDGGILFAGGKYHWYGMALRPLPVGNGPDGGQKTTVGVVMYSSTDLYNWTYEGVILACSPDPANPLHGPMRFERPKIIYNRTTRQYVLWFHYVGYPGNHGTAIGTGDAGVAVSSRVNGPYAFRGYSRPIDANGVVRDFTLFQDDDGAAYFLYDRDVPQPLPGAGRVLHIVKLTADYLGFSSTFYEIANASRREAPVIFKRNGFYFLITSAETGWKNNAANYYRSTSILGPYTELGNPCIGPDPELTFDAQGAYAFPIHGKPNEIVFLAERHITTRMTDSSYIFLPIQFPTPSTLQLQYLPTWRLSHWPPR
ncbi:MAG: glycoside hydrolase family 43 protein [Acidobacteriaceae bacterium]|jgi:beta-galactosidase